MTAGTRCCACACHSSECANDATFRALVVDRERRMQEALVSERQRLIALVQQNGVTFRDIGGGLRIVEYRPAVSAHDLMRAIGQWLAGEEPAT